MEWDTFADLPPLEAANPPLLHPPPQPHNPPPLPPPANRAPSASLPTQSSAAVAIPAVVRGVSALSSASSASGTGSPSRRHKGGRSLATSATSSSSSSSSSSSHSSASDNSDDERRERRKSKKKKNKKRREKEKEKERERDREKQQQQRDRSASPAPNPDVTAALDGMTKAMRLLAATTQRTSSGNTSGSSSSKSKKRDKDRAREKDNKRNKKDKRRSSTPPPTTASAASSSNKNRNRPSSRNNQPTLPANGITTAITATHQPAQPPLPAYLGEYERVVRRLAEEERALLAAQRRLEAEVRSELDKRRKRREQKQGEEKADELNFVARFLLNGTSKGGAALRRPAEEKERERERRQRGLPMYGSDADERDADEEDDDDESSHEEEDEDEEEERKRRKAQRLQRRRERREAKEAREAAERARIDQQLVDETIPFIQALSMQPTTASHDDHREVVEERKEVAEAKVKEERVVVKAEERKEAGEEEDVMGRPLLDGVKPDEQQLFEQPPPSTFDGIEQDAWEQRIVYDDQQLKAEDEHKQEQQAAQARRQRAITALKAEPVTTTTAATASSASSPLSFSSFSLPSLSSSFSAASDSRPSVQLTWLKSASAADRARMRYMGLERVNPAQFTVAAVAAAQPSTTAVVSRGRSEWKGVVVQPLNETAKGGVVLGERLLSHHINQSLLTNDWLAAIIYDESDLTTNHNHLLSHNALLLDQNDTQLFLPPTHTLTHLANHTHTPQPPLTDQYGRYNISHDSAAGWGGGGDGQLGSLRVLKILHASFAANLDPLVYRTHLTSAELAHYHRPLLSLPADVATTMAVKAEGASGAGGGAGGEEREQARYVPRSMEELSASDGDIIVCEYLERHPPLLMNVGMCSQLITYYRKQSDLDIHEPSALDGDVVVLTTKDGSPFLSQLRPGQTVTALTNNMYIAPVVRHVPTPHTFLLMRVVGANYWTVRSLPSGCYVVGQEEPKLSVPYPDRSHAYDLLKKQLEVFIYKRLRSNQRRISANDIGREFGHSVVVDTIARRVLKDLGTLDRSRNEWTLRAVERPSEEKLQLLCTPEDVCCYEAMRAADSRLKESGVRRFTNVKAISDIIDQLTQDDVSRVAIYIEKQLHLMPWTLTKGFLAAKDGKGTLRLTGRGNPFAEGCGFSYINEKVTAKKTSTDADHFPELQEPKKKTGTNADLRKLTMDEMGAALQKLGMGADEVAKLLRWDRVRAIARLSMEAVQEGKYPNLKRFARQARPTSAKMMEEYRRDIAAIFDRQLAMLAWSGRPDYSHEVDDDVAAVKEKGGARKVRERQGGGGGRSEFLAAKKKEREEEEEYKEFLASREKALKSDQNTANKPTDRSKLTTTTANSLKPTTINSPNTTATTAAPATPALAGATPPTTAAAPGKKKKKVLITKLQHVIKVTNKDGSQTVHTKMYSDKDTLRDFVLDCQSAYTESSSNGQRLRQRLQLNSLPALEGGTGGKKGDGKEGGKGGKEEDEDDEGGERQLKGVPQVELIPITGISKIKTLDAYLAKYTKAGRQHAASAAADKARTRWKGGGRGGGGENVEWMFTLDDDDWNRAGDPFRFPPDASPSAGGAGGHSAGGASLLTSTSSGTLKLSLKQLHQTPQDVYVKSKMKRKLTASDTEPSSTSSLMQPYKKKVLSRRRGDPRIFLSSCLEDILNVVSEFDYAAPFREPVTDDIAEDYAVRARLCHTSTSNCLPCILSVCCIALSHMLGCVRVCCCRCYLGCHPQPHGSEDNQEQVQQDGVRQQRRISRRRHTHAHQL